MPFNKESYRAEQVRAVLAGLDRNSYAIVAVAGYAALVVLIASGEWMAAWFPGEFPAVRSLVRGMHLVGGWVVALWVLGRGSALVVRWGRKVLLRERHTAPAEMGDTVKKEAIPVALALAGAAFWVLLALMVLSGLERYLWLRLGWGILPLDPALWWPFHRALRPFFYAVMLIILVNHGKIWVKRTLYYLQAP